MLTPPINTRDHITGNPQGTIELVEYGDFQCPYCGEAYPLVKHMLQALQDVKFIFRHFPLSEAHEYATDAALAAEAAGRQGKFWEMHDALYENQAQLSEGLLSQLAKILRLDMKQFAADMEDHQLLSKVEADFESGVRSGVNGTPTFFINGKRYNGDFTDLLSTLNGTDASESEI
ncbi:DsbA family protein [Chitinophaga solisilvae]|uniref:DsbA family protein n=1 Tax=Chitinophaga solisilvae TaxID=1233460 RepID=UPI00136E5ACD|nr:thioredoxin domain-containing protein [Chitinophaga solisilvae]